MSPIMHQGTNVPRDYFVAFLSPSKSARRKTFPPQTYPERRHFSASPRNSSPLAALLRQIPSVSGRPSTGRHGQRPDPPEHRPEQAGRQVTPRQQEPVV